METASLYLTEKSLTPEDVQSIQEGAAFLIKRYTGEKIWEKTVVEIYEHPLERTVRLQKEFNCGEYMRNMVQCNICNEIVESTNRHDFRKCKCGSISVDGGTSYLRRLGNYMTDCQEMSVQWPWVIIIERESKNGSASEDRDDHADKSQEVAGEQEQGQ